MPSRTGGTTLTGPITANTLRVTSSYRSDNTIANAGNSITLNGLIGVGAGRTTISGAGNLLIGATKELVVNWTVGIQRHHLSGGGQSRWCVIGDLNNRRGGEHLWMRSGATGVTSTYTGGTTINYPAGGRTELLCGQFRDWSDHGEWRRTSGSPINTAAAVANSFTINGGGGSSH